LFSRRTDVVCFSFSGSFFPSVLSFLCLVPPSSSWVPSGACGSRSPSPSLSLFLSRSGLPLWGSRLWLPFLAFAPSSGAVCLGRGCAHVPAGDLPWLAQGGSAYAWVIIGSCARRSHRPATQPGAGGLSCFGCLRVVGARRTTLMLWFGRPPDWPGSACSPSLGVVLSASPSHLLWASALWGAAPGFWGRSRGLLGGPCSSLFLSPLVLGWRFASPLVSPRAACALWGSPAQRLVFRGAERSTRS